MAFGQAPRKQAWVEPWNEGWEAVFEAEDPPRAEPGGWVDGAVLQVEERAGGADDGEGQAAHEGSDHGVGKSS